MFADLCFAIQVQNFLLDHEHGGRGLEETSRFFITTSGNTLFMSLHMIRSAANSALIGYTVSVSTERNDYGTFSVYCRRSTLNVHGIQTVVSQSMHYVNTVREFSAVFDTHWQPALRIAL